VHIVGHSLGGMIARYYVQRMGGSAAVGTLVTLGGPHTGTVTAQLLPTPISRLLDPVPVGHRHDCRSPPDADAVMFSGFPATRRVGICPPPRGPANVPTSGSRTGHVGSSFDPDRSCGNPTPRRETATRHS
jgi:pimeloyl-ACP methyl ester carboxylesterase